MLFSTLLVLSLAAQDAPPADPGAAIRAAAMAFSACIQQKIVSVPATLTPEAGADSVIAACKPQQDAIEQAAEQQIAKAPSEQQASARQQLKDGLAYTRPSIIAGLTQMRAAPTPAAPATPAPPK